jgi:hypothetical protein
MVGGDLVRTCARRFQLQNADDHYGLQAHELGPRLLIAQIDVGLLYPMWWP